MCCDTKEQYLEFWGYELGTQEAEEAWQRKCEMMANQKPDVDAPLVSIFHEGFYEHLDSKPIYISSKRQLREECRKRGLTSDYAE